VAPSHPIKVFNTEAQRMAKQAVARTLDLEPIDRLEEKIKLLVGLVTQLRADHARAAEDNARLMQELEAVRGRLAEAELASTEITELRDERDIIRTRVAEMLQQLEAI
jgi:regulator of replication initiation timing